MNVYKSKVTFSFAEMKCSQQGNDVLAQFLSMHNYDTWNFSFSFQKPTRRETVDLYRQKISQRQRWMWRGPNVKFFTNSARKCACSRSPAASMPSDRLKSTSSHIGVTFWSEYTTWNNERHQCDQTTNLNFAIGYFANALDETRSTEITQSYCQSKLVSWSSSYKHDGCFFFSWLLSPFVVRTNNAFP